MDPKIYPPEILVNEKTPYSPPAFVEYGALAKLTQGQMGTMPDGGSGFDMGNVMP
jgi:hypothetical protein